MIKCLCLLLTACFIFSLYAAPPLQDDTVYENTDEDNGSVTIDLTSLSDIRIELDENEIAEEDAEKYDICLLIEAREDTALDLSASRIIADDNEIDEALYQHRVYVKEHYLQHNQQLVDKMSLNECNYTVSFYAPYVEVIFDDIYEYELYEKTLVDKAEANKDIISSISSFVIAMQGTDDATVNGENEIPYPFAEAIEDIEADDSEFTGEGIKVGVFEEGFPDSTLNLKEGLYTFLDGDSDDYTETPHCTAVTSIIGGNTGIAGDVHFYCGVLSMGLTNVCNRLIGEYNVDIINMSNGITSVWYYSKADVYIDRIVSNSGCTVVKSSGTDDGSKDYITVPGYSVNAITVGAMDYDKNIRYDSIWETGATLNFLLKPDIVAPGGNISNIENIEDTFGGTSAATPMVTGVIALLMEEFPILRCNPDLVKSLVHVGAEKLPSQTSYFDEQAGFGLINYQNMRNCMLNSEYELFTVQPSDSEGASILVPGKAVTIPYLDRIEINANIIINSSDEYSDYNNSIVTSATGYPIYTDYVIKLFDLGTSTYVAESTVDSSVDYLTFTNLNANNSSFRIDIVLAETETRSGAELGTIAYTIVHDHSYTDHYTWQSIGLHKSYCRCDSYITSYHVVAPGSLVGPDGYTICMLCRGRAPIGNLLSVPEGLAHTDNGSYILPNGTIVLVEEDVEAYLAGTLEFYYGEKE